MSTTFQISLVQQAKSSGGDKYLINSGDSLKESFIYVPQRLSRVQGQGKCMEKLIMHIRNGRTDDVDEMEFELLKKGKTGDDRYKSSNEVLWKGDIYLPQEFRNDTSRVYISVVRD